MGRTSIETFDNAFYGSNTAIPLCGTVVNKRECMGNLIQALLSTDLSDKDVVAGNPVIMNNVVTDSGTDQMGGMNADTFEITGLGSTAIDGFLLTSDMDIQDSDGGAPYAHTGLLYNVATYKSGVETWLPCEAALAGVVANTPLYWDTTNLYLTATVTNDELPIKMISAVVDGLYLFKNATSGLIEWVATKCVKVKF